MANPLEIILTDQERQELEKARDTHTKPYIRERSAAIVKIANGESGHQAALHGLYKPRSPDTIYDWVHRYQQEGLEALFIHEGRGRKASFSPSVMLPKTIGRIMPHPQSLPISKLSGLLSSQYASQLVNRRTLYNTP